MLKKLNFIVSFIWIISLPVFASDNIKLQNTLDEPLYNVTIQYCNVRGEFPGPEKCGSEDVPWPPIDVTDKRFSIQVPTAKEWEAKKRCECPNKDAISIHVQVKRGDTYRSQWSLFKDRPTKELKVIMQNQFPCVQGGINDRGVCE